MSDVIDRLELENDELRERVRQLEAALLADQEWRAPRIFNLTRTEERILAGLVARGTVSKSRLMLVLYDGRAGDAPQPKIFDVLICKLRKKLRPYDITIETIWGEGYKLSDQDYEKIKSWQDEGAA